MVLPLLDKHCSHITHLSVFVCNKGAVFGAIASVEVICSVLGTIIFNSIYSSTLQISSGFVFFAMAAFYGAGCGILM